MATFKVAARLPAVFALAFTLAACGGGSSSGGAGIRTENSGSVEGTVTDASSGDAISGVTVQIGDKSDVTGGNGVYAIKNLDVGERTIISFRTDYQTYNGTVPIQNGGITKHDIEMILEGVVDATYSVGGTVSGLAGALLLRNNDGDDLSIDADGAFNFATVLTYGSSYGVTVLTQPSGQSCDIKNGSGTSRSNITNVKVTCFDFDLIRVSVNSDGTQGNSQSRDLSINADGRYVVFGSSADNLVAGDTNGNFDAFIHDTQDGTTTLLSVASDGTQGNAESKRPSISADGTRIAFISWADNLVAGDTNGVEDIFVHDTQTGVTTRVSVASDGTEGNGKSTYPGISPDGKYVAFHSRANNLVAGDTNTVADVFVHDTQTGETTRVSVASAGNGCEDLQGKCGDSYRPAVSNENDNGERFVAFYSKASNIVDGDINGYADVFVHNMDTGATTRISVPDPSTGESEGNGESYINEWSNISITPDGRYVAFISDASNLVAGDTNYDCDNNGDGEYVNNRADVFVRDTQDDTTTLVSMASDGTQGNGDSYRPSISSDGRYISFISKASNLVAGDTNGKSDVFLRDIINCETKRLSIPNEVDQTTLGTESNGDSKFSYISADGQYVAFWSWASNLVMGDTNEQTDVFRVFNPLYVVP